MKLKPQIFVWALLTGLICNTQFSFSQEVRYDSGGRRDPFVPVDRTNVGTTTGGGLQIEGIIYDPQGKSVVVIQGEPFAEGDTTGTHKIVKIEANKVTASENGVETDYWISNTEKEIAQNAKL